MLLLISGIRGQGLFFSPCTSRTVDVSLWLKNSNHMITFFAALRFRKSSSRDAIFCCSPQREKHETMLMPIKTSRLAIMGNPGKALAEEMRRRWKIFFRFFFFPRLWEERRTSATWSVFSKPQSHKKCYHVIRIFQTQTEINSP